MNLVASNVKVVGRNQYNTKEGEAKFNVMLSNGTGNPLQLKCTRQVYETVVPFDKTYDVEVNLDTVGYNIYGDLLIITES